jgi:hypothetical protein
MGTPSKPTGYSSVSPYLVVEGAQCVIDFLKRAFDATERRRYDMPDGTIMHAEVQIDDTVVMIADGGGEWPPFRRGCVRVHVDATYHRALEAGGSVQNRSSEEIRTAGAASGSREHVVDRTQLSPSSRLAPGALLRRTPASRRPTCAPP